MSRRPSHVPAPHRRVPKGRRPPAPTSPGRERPRIWLCVAALVLFGSLAYANSLDGVFVIDDSYTIVDNPNIRTPWSTALLRSSWGESAVLGRPVVALTFALNHSLHGLDVRGYHLGNIAVHLLCTLVLFGLIRRIRGSTVFAFVCASLWMLHPLNSEVVTYISQRSESMMALCYLLTIYASVRMHQASGPRPHGLWFAIAVVASALGILSKQSMVTIPLAVLLVDYAFFFDSLASALRSRWRVYLAVTAASLPVGIVTALVSPSSSAVGFSSGPSPWVYLLNQSVIITHYLTLTVWPHRLVADYGYPVSYTLTDVLPQMVFIGGLFVLSVVAVRYRRKLGFLGLWVFLTLGVTSSVAPIATEVGAERRMYLPLAALVVLGVAPLAQLAQYLVRHERLSRRAVAVGCVVLWAGTATALGMRTAVRNRDYSSRLRLAQVNVEHWPTAYSRHALGAELIAEGRRDEGVALLRQSIPEDARAHFSLGQALFEAGQLREAREQLETFVRLRPLRIEAVEARAMIGRALIAEGRLEEAAAQFRQVLEMQRSFFDAHLGLAEVYVAQERYDLAVSHYRAYFARGGTNPRVWTHLGAALTRAGRLDEATDAFLQAIERKPDAAEAHRSLAAVLMARNRIPAAVHHAERAVALNPGDAASRDLLGLTLVAQGRRDLAAVQFREALRLDPTDDTPRQHLEDMLRQ